MFSPKKHKKTVKKSFVLAGGIFVFLFLTFNFTNFSLLHTVFAAPDQELTYHGKLTDNLGLSVPNGPYDFTFTIYDSASGTNVLWTDMQTLTVTNGIFSTALTGLDTLTFDANYYLGVQIGSNIEMIPRRKITPTGFALNAHRLNGLTADNYIDTSATTQAKQGDLTLNGDLTVDGILYDSNGDAGNNGQILSTTASGTNWIDAPSGATTFLGLVDTPSTYTANRIFFTDATGTSVTDSSNFTFDGNNLTIGGNILPTVDDTYTLGDTTHRWQDLFLGPSSLHIGSSTTDEGVISYDATNNVLNIGTDTVTNGDIAFNTDQLFISSTSGNVGIGTTITNEKLTVDGLISLAEQTTTPSVDAGYGKLYARDDGKLYYQNGNGEEENISQVKKLVEEFVVDEGSSVDAGDVVAFVNEKIKKGTNITNFGPEGSLNAGDYIEANNVSSAKLDSTHFVMVFADGSGYGTAIIGTVSGSTITYGAENIFNTDSTSYATVSSLDDTHFVVAYRDGGNSNYGTAIIGTVSGSTITYGAEYVFNATSTDGIAVTMLDTTHIAIAYHDGAGSVVIGTVSGSTITYGAEYVFNATSTDGIAVTMLDTTHIAIAYHDGAGSVVIGTVSGSTITYGAEYVFNAVTTNFISIHSLDSAHFVASYRDDGNSNQGTAIIGTVSGSTITYGAEYVFNAARTYHYISATRLDSSKFAVVFNDNADGDQGKAIIGTVSGSTITYGAEYVFHNSGGLYDLTSTTVAALDATNFVIGYGDYNNLDYGTGIIGSVSGSVIAYGTKYVFNASEHQIISDMSVALLDDTHFVVAYRDGGNSNYGTAIIGTVSGSAITYGAEYVFNAATTYNLAVAALDATHFVVAHSYPYGTAMVGTVSGSDITFFASNNFNATSNDTGDISMATLDATHFVVFYKDNTAGYAVARVGTISGTVITSYGTAANVSAVDTYAGKITALDATHFATTYVTVSNGYGVGRVASVVLSTGAITLGTAVNFNAASTDYSPPPSITSLDATHFAVAYKDQGNSSFGTVRVASVSGTTITYGTESVFNSASTEASSINMLGIDRFVVNYQDGGNSGQGTSIIGMISGTTVSAYAAENVFSELHETNVIIESFMLNDFKFLLFYNDIDHAKSVLGEFSNKYLGIAQESCAANESCPVALPQTQVTKLVWQFHLQRSLFSHKEAQIKEICILVI